MLRLAVGRAGTGASSAGALTGAVLGERFQLPRTPLLRRLTADNGWRHDVICDAHGRLEAVTYVRVGPAWTDSVAIAGEDQALAVRHRTSDDRLILPTELPSESRAVWRRYGRCEDVLTELFELPDP